MDSKSAGESQTNSSPPQTSTPSQFDLAGVLPEFVFIGGIQVPVKLAKMAPGDFGEWRGYPSPSITVNGVLEAPAAFMTILHESLHGISEMYELGLTERDVRVLEIALSDLFRRTEGLRHFGEKI
jgi:hypothetical protein